MNNRLCRKCVIIALIVLLLGLSSVYGALNSNVVLVNDGGGSSKATQTQCSHYWVRSSYKAPTCTTTGLATYRCIRCFKTKAETIVPSAHSYKISTDKANLKAGNCLTGAVYYKVCSVCGKKGPDTYKQARMATHMMSSKNVYESKNSGLHAIYNECQKCNYRKLIATEKHTLVITSTYENYNSKQHYRIYKCKNCGYISRVVENHVYTLKNNKKCVCGRNGNYKINFILFGGAGDTLDKDNNLFVQLISGKKFDSIMDYARFIKSPGDYANGPSKDSADSALDSLKDKNKDNDYNVVGGYSHGGQAAFFMDYTNVDKLVLVDGIVGLRGYSGTVYDKDKRDFVKAEKGKGLSSQIGEVWGKRLIEIASENTEILLCISGDRDHGTVKNAESTITYLDQYVKNPSILGSDVKIEKDSNGNYVIKDKNGKVKGTIEVYRIKSDRPGYNTHGQACVNAADKIADFSGTKKS